MSSSSPPPDLIEIPDYQQIAETFALELRESADGKQTSIPFLTTPLPGHAVVGTGDLFQVFVIGGTNGATALVRSEGQRKFSIIQLKKFILPKFETGEDFFLFLEKYASAEVTAIALNFAFTLLPVITEQGALDGIMSSGDTKGHAFIGLQKELVGKSVHDYFLRQGKDIIVTVANDTICLLLSALQVSEERARVIAGIVGTGYNLAIFHGENDAINLQASDFSSFTQTDSGKIVDGESTNKGEQLYNKEVAAGELYKHFNIYIDLLTLPVGKIDSTEALGRVAFQGEGVASQVAQELFARSASLVAAQLAGLYTFKGKPERLDCVMEGSLFWKVTQYRQVVEKELSNLGVPKGGIVFQEVAESGILGGIRLAMG